MQQKSSRIEIPPIATLIPYEVADQLLKLYLKIGFDKLSDASYAV